MLNKAPSLFLAAQVCLFSFLFPPFQTQHTNDHAVSACHGAGGDPISPTCYPSRFFQWWNTVFPRPATELTNGALRRTNSGYSGYCNSHHLPDQTDLVIIELDTEDEPCVSFFLSFLFRFFRFSSVSFVSPPFLSFLFRFFRFSSVSFVPPVFFSLLFIISLLRPPYAHPTHAILSSPPPNDGLSHTNQGRRPSCSFAHLSSAMASSWLYPFHIFHTAMTITIFLAAHLGDFRLWSPILLRFPFLRNTPRLEG